MTLATHLEDTWVATVYYGTDENTNLYIVTAPNSKHGKHLEKNQDVAFAIFDSHTKITQNKQGIQGQGTCALVKNPAELIIGLSLWHESNPGKEGRITVDMIKKALDTKLYKIKPTYLKFFNKDFYGNSEYGEWKS